MYAVCLSTGHSTSSSRCRSRRRPRRPPSRLARGTHSSLIHTVHSIAFTTSIASLVTCLDSPTTHLPTSPPECQPPHCTQTHLAHTSILHSRSQRKAAPSPLQTSTTAGSPPASVTPTRSTFDTFSSPRSTQHHSSEEGPRSPKERLDDLLASEKSFYRSEGESSTDREQKVEGKTPKYVVMPPQVVPRVLTPILQIWTLASRYEW